MDYLTLLAVILTFAFPLGLCLWHDRKPRKPLVCVWCNKTLTGKSRYWCHDCASPEWTR